MNNEDWQHLIAMVAGAAIGLFIVYLVYLALPWPYE